MIKTYDMVKTYLKNLNLVFFVWNWKRNRTTVESLNKYPWYSLLYMLCFCSISHLKDALTKFGEITNNLEFARELQKSFLTLGQEVHIQSHIITVYWKLNK